MVEYNKYAKLKEEKGVTDYRVAKDTEIATTTLYDWKNGISVPKLDKLMILANYFGVPIEYFLSDSLIN